MSGIGGLPETYCRHTPVPEYDGFFVGGPDSWPHSDPLELVEGWERPGETQDGPEGRQAILQPVQDERNGASAASHIPSFSRKRESRNAGHKPACLAQCRSGFPITREGR